MITIKTGDLLNATETVIGHQVNCFGAAGGLAYDVFCKYPNAEKEYFDIVNWVRTSDLTPHALLGTVQCVTQPDGHVVANLFGQLHPGANYCPAALEAALIRLKPKAQENGWSVALPYKLSCGICGGNWDEVLEIIERTMDGVECVIYQREEDK